MKNRTLEAAAASTILMVSGATAAINYVDADFATNTTLADGTAMNLVADEATAGAGNPEDYYVTGGTVNTIPAAPNNWGERTRSSVNGPSVLVGPQGSGSDAPELRTRITGLPDGTYNVYAYFIRDIWGIEAGLVSGSLTAFTGAGGGANATLAVGGDFTSAVDLQDSPGLDLYQASLGTAVVTGGVLDIYIDDDAANNQRAWYEGVGYEIVPEPSSAALFAMAGLGILGRRRRH